MTVKPKYRRPLSNDQIHTLKIIYKFRFISASSIAESTGKYKSVIYSRLKILYEQGYIGKNHDKSYRLQGKPASYYLLPKALKLIRSNDSEYCHPKVIRNMYKNQSVTQQFIDHSLNSLVIYVKFKQLYGPKAITGYFSRTELARFDYFLTPRPDAYFYTKRADKFQDYVIENLEEATPWFVIKKRIQQYMTHLDEGVWSDSGSDIYPTVLLICETDKLYRRLKRHIRRTLEDIYTEGLLFGLTTTEAFFNSTDKKDRIWLPVNDEIGVRTALGRLTSQVA